MSRHLSRRLQSPSSARRSGAFYGWWMLLFCTVVRGFTVPGQTIGVSAFTDDIVDSLNISRSGFSTAYMVGTLAGAIALPFIGRWVDRIGVKLSMKWVSMAFAVAIALTGTVQNIVMLALAFLGLRLLGQGALSLISLTGIVVWFDRRRGRALALTGMGSLGILSLAPLVFGALISAVGWRAVWPILGLAVAVVVIPIALFGIVDRPEALGQVPDGRVDQQPPSGVVRQRSSTVAEAIRTPAFWTLAGLTLLMGAVATGLTLHNTDLLAEGGLSKSQANAVFLPQAVGSIVSSFVVASMTDRFAARPLMFFGGSMLAVGTFLATVAEPGLLAIAYGVCTGLAMGSISALSGALYPKWFGIDHIGSIKGIVSSMNIAGSAVGPLILSVGNDLADSYTPIVIACSIASASMAVVALLVRPPDAI